MAIGDFAFASNGNRFLAAAPLDRQTFAVCGIPFDGAVTNRPGARFGPQEIRRASLMLCDGIHPYFNLSPLDQVGDAGDMKLPHASGLAPVRQDAVARRMPKVQAEFEALFEDRVERHAVAADGERHDDDQHQGQNG